MADPTRRARRPGRRARPAFLVALSGAAALVYESLWMRSFGLIFGGETSAVAMVLAVFMGGLALGSALAARRPSVHPLRAYARVELAIGATALLTLPLLRALPWAYGALVARAGLTGALEHLGLALARRAGAPSPDRPAGGDGPAGGRVPRPGRHARARRLRPPLSRSTRSAVRWEWRSAPFVLVPVLGVRATLVAAATASLFVGAVTRRWANEIGPLPPLPPAAPEEAEPGPSGLPPGPSLGHSLAFASGAATFGVEVLWTRSYALVIGSSVYAFNLMLLAVLLGIASGTALYARLRDRVTHPAHAVGVLFVGAGIAVLAGQWTIGQLPIAYLAALAVLPVSFAAHQAAGLVLCLVDHAAGHGRARADLPAAAPPGPPRRRARRRPRAGSTPGTRRARSSARWPPTWCW